MNNWSKSSKKKLQECHNDLQILANEVLQVHDCTVVWGYRDEEIQNELYHEGKSQLKYPYSKHNEFPAIAIDLAPYVPSLGGATWDREYSLYFSGLVLGIADRLYKSGAMQHKIRWGGNWSTDRETSFKTVNFYDGLHFELEID